MVKFGDIKPYELYKSNEKLSDVYGCYPQYSMTYVTSLMPQPFVFFDFVKTRGVTRNAPINSKIYKSRKELFAQHSDQILNQIFIVESMQLNCFDPGWQLPGQSPKRANI